MTVDKLYRLFQEQCASDPSLRSLKRKINSGKADFTDTAAYSERIATLLGQTLSKYIDGIPEGSREQICKWLLQEQYKDTNTICAVVQEALDEAKSIRLTPQKAPFPSERVQTVAHALEDPTVKPETIRRRANAPVANVAKSFHDDYVKVNARVRNDLGLKPTITRYGTGCCAWCSAVAGKYRFGEQPEDIFRRHDNCDCVIIYDTQVLRGKQTADGGRSKTWEEVDPSDVVQNPPAVLSQEEAENLQNTVLQGLTLAGRRDIIESELGTFRNRLRSDVNMDSSYYETIKTRFSHGSEIAKKAFNNYVPADSIADSSYTSVPHYDPVTKRIFMNYFADQQNTRGGGATWFHEHGHLIDDAAGHLSSDSAFYEALFKDKSAYTKSIIREHGTKSVAETYSVLQNELCDFRSQSGVSDIFNGLSAGIIQGCGFHSASYWTKERVAQEAFAHMYEAQFDSVRYAQMKHYFPTALARFEELLGGAVK